MPELAYTSETRRYPDADDDYKALFDEETQYRWEDEDARW